MQTDGEPGLGGVTEGIPLVSVVIPCFNQAHFLGEAIESVTSQTQAAADIVIVDDGSTDNTHVVAKRYPSVRCLRQENRGVAAARNVGLANSGGEFVVFLDADDRLLPEALEVGTSALKKRPHVGFVAGMSRDIGNDGRERGGKSQPLVMQDHFLRLLMDCFIWSGSSIAYRRSTVEAVGGFDESLSAGDDYDLYLRIAARFPIYCHDAVVTEYRRHGSNTTRDSAVVLVSQLEVLKRQRSRLRGRREKRAYRTGLRRTRAEHGRALARQTVAAWQAGQKGRALRGLRTLARRNFRALVAIPEFRR